MAPHSAAPLRVRLGFEDVDMPDETSWLCTLHRICSYFGVSVSPTAKRISVIMGYISLDGFARGSSEVDWCESNYTISSYVAEFWNVLSNVLFFAVPPVLIYLFRPYARRVTGGVNIVWTLLMVTGLGSVYFHSTLCLVGQLIDEISIIWVVMVALGLWFPKIYIPAILHKSRQRCKALMLLLSLLSTCLAFVYPAINSIALFVLAVPGSTILVIKLKRCRSRRVYNIGMRVGIAAAAALASWLSDRMFCHFWQAIHFPYMHCFWHILIFLSSAQCCVLFAYFDAMEEVPEANPKIQFWPSDEHEILGIPYISFHPLESSKFKQNIHNLYLTIH
ncbi:Alkaline ceramidase 2 [Lamellibrachia satsuma]|nr:Alkaline ceramidase 2 [Lamellibrachia satsuma]